MENQTKTDEQQQQLQQSQSTMCNICRQPDERANLLTPCACAADTDIGFVHFQCIKIWIETSGGDVCSVCKKPFSRGLAIRKRRGRFGRFFYHSEPGRLYSQLTFLFFILFYASYLGQFHSRLLYHRGWQSSAMMITVFNVIYLLVHTVLFIVYLIMIYLTFAHWRRTNFDIEVRRAN